MSVPRHAVSAVQLRALTPTLPPRPALGVGCQRQLHQLDRLPAGVDTRSLGIDPPADHSRRVAGDAAGAVGIARPHHNRVHALDRAGLDLVLQALGDLALIAQTALLEPEPGDIDQTGRVGRLPPADRADERALDVERIGTDGLGQDVGGQDLTFLEQVG